MIPIHRLLVVALLATACTGDDARPPRDADSPRDTDDTGTAGGCEPADMDCAGVCSGAATVDGCGVCDDDATNDCLLTATVTDGWICPIGVSCQDVWSVELAADAVVSVLVDGVHGDSVVRLAVFPPDVALDGANVLVGASRDLACAGPDEDAAVSFVADVAGTWRIAVGRDAGSSVGAAGSYTLTAASPTGIGLSGPETDDLPTEAPPEPRCGSEYVLDGDWTCEISESCQDSFAVDLPAGTTFELSALEISGDSVVRFALYEPGVALGGLDVLTNNTNDRSCGGQDDDQILVPYVTEQPGVHTVAVGRDWGESSGMFGRYRLVIAGDTFFDAPTPGVDDTNALAPDEQCGWTWATSGSWTCEVGGSCQDVFDVAVPSGASLSTGVVDVTGASVVRLAAFAPGEPLSGTNLITGTNEDQLCGIPDGRASFAPIAVTTGGVHRVAVGRDASSVGASGTYEATITVEDGYGAVSPTVDDQVSEAAGTSCP